MVSPPARKLRVGVLGATGAVGQRLVALLEDHPYFELAEVVASPRSQGRPYGQVVEWRLPSPLPPAAAQLLVRPLRPELDCQLVFSALDSAVAGAAEEEFAASGYPVVSNCRNHRMDADVPLVVPEVNPDHLQLLDAQRQGRGWSSGFILTNPNCSTIGAVMALKPLADSFGLRQVLVVTMQAISGAGHRGLDAHAVYDNVIPHIGGEEEKLESEPLKIMGRLSSGGVRPARFEISAQCNRVAVLDGHTESVFLRLERQATPADLEQAWRSFAGLPQKLGLPSAPARPLLVRSEPDRPQPRLDRDAERAMAVSLGRLRPWEPGGYKFSLVVHNAVRGAAGAALLNAELALATGRLGSARPAPPQAAGLPGCPA